jgi:hypothetical protein
MGGPTRLAQARIALARNVFGSDLTVLQAFIFAKRKMWRRSVISSSLVDLRYALIGDESISLAVLGISH